MAGYTNFEVNRNKYTNGIKDVFKRGVNPNKSVEILSRDERLREGFKLWTSFYRENPHKFVEDYFGLKLHLFQKILIYMCFHVDFFMYLAARGQGKSWLIAIICCVRCVLWPSTQCIVASGTKGQARLIITQKIDKILRSQSPNLAREIKDVKTGQNDCVVVFHNGSTIEAVTSTNNSRGYRGNFLVLDEFRLIDKEMLDKVLRMFLTVNRQPPYLTKPEYAHLTEENKEIYISSAWYKNHWIWEKFKSFSQMMCKGKDFFVCAFPYELSIFHGLLSEKRVQQMKEEDDYDPITWYMEMDCMFFGESENAFFKLNDIQKCRTLIKPFYPIDNVKFLEAKTKTKVFTKQNGEYRIIGVDIAMMGGNKNDNTVYTCMRLLPNKDEYIRQVVYIETLNGEHSETQAIRLKQLFNDFEADYIAMDTQGNGLSLYDDCARILYDSDRDIEYPAWCAMNNQEMADRALGENAVPIIYSIKVVSREINHEIAMFLKTSFEKNKIKLLTEDIKGKEYLSENNKEYIKKSLEEQLAMEMPYIQTTMLINELVNLEYEINNGFVKLKETGSRRKDRYSSLGYANYFSKILEAEIRDDNNSISDPEDYFLFN